MERSLKTRRWEGLSFPMSQFPLCASFADFAVLPVSLSSGQSISVSLVSGLSLISTLNLFSLLDILKENLGNNCAFQVWVSLLSHFLKRLSHTSPVRSTYSIPSPPLIFTLYWKPKHNRRKWSHLLLVPTQLTCLCTWLSSCCQWMNWPTPISRSLPCALGPIAKVLHKTFALSILPFFFFFCIMISSFILNYSHQYPKSGIISFILKRENKTLLDIMHPPTHNCPIAMLFLAAKIFVSTYCLHLTFFLPLLVLWNFVMSSKKCIRFHLVMGFLQV